MRQIEIVRFLFYCVKRAVLHPKTPISYYYCHGCKIRFNSKDKECPRCHDKVENSPSAVKESPVPWYCSSLMILIGAAIWVFSAVSNIDGIAELGRILVYVPLGNLFGMSIPKQRG